MLNPNIVIPFDGTHATIPSGFVRDTLFDNRFPKGDNAGLGETAGASAHTHTATHVHQITSHQHLATSGQSHTHTSEANAGTSGGNPITGHTHGYGAYAYMNHTGDSSSTSSGSTAASLVSTSHLPPYYTVIFIKSQAYNPIPTNGMIYSVNDRPGMTFHTASDGKFLRGANTGANAGGTGGASTHNHTQSHTHTAVAHSHATGVLNGYTGESEGGMTPFKPADGWHQHTFEVATGTQAIANNVDSSSLVNHEPVFKTIKHYKATGQTLVQKGDIALFTGSVVPQGWKVCDGTLGTPNMHSYFVKNSGTSNNTGGANTHTHTLNHAHSASGTHTHVVPNVLSGKSGTLDGINGSGKTVVGAHYHNVNTPVETKGVGQNSTNVTSSADSNEPDYIKVKYIQFDYAQFGGGMVFL